MKYTEDAVVEQPAIQLFPELEGETRTCWEEAFGPESDLGRNTRGDMNHGA